MSLLRRRWIISAVLCPPFGQLSPVLLTSAMRVSYDFIDSNPPHSRGSPTWLEKSNQFSIKIFSPESCGMPQTSEGAYTLGNCLASNVITVESEIEMKCLGLVMECAARARVSMVTVPPPPETSVFLMHRRTYGFRGESTEYIDVPILSKRIPAGSECCAFAPPNQFEELFSFGAADISAFVF